MNCALAVLQATTGNENPQLMEIAGAFGAGIGGSKCLCGAVSGGVMALGLRGQRKRAGELVAAFKARNRITCCKGLSAGYAWMSREHRQNCRRMTMETAEIVDRLLRR
ncbi:C-GCAxxG-C-C family protein [Desulfuromonas sp. DDH964]|uniref:C-GCAxxG-C-C family protein n=1 Tax=Desulfuromonas sp. DDH964 TaxID=1823759 RepID=UPI0018D3D556|nr:C-GCAxxG-C-C family protein [Desulfuromonas sp. DDH964]